jgi:hypothetical protein
VRTAPQGSPRPPSSPRHCGPRPDPVAPARPCPMPNIRRLRRRKTTTNRKESLSLPNGGTGGKRNEWRTIGDVHNLTHRACLPLRLQDTHKLSCLLWARCASHTGGEMERASKVCLGLLGDIRNLASFTAVSAMATTAEAKSFTDVIPTCANNEPRAGERICRHSSRTRTTLRESSNTGADMTWWSPSVCRTYVRRRIRNVCAATAIGTVCTPYGEGI